MSTFKILEALKTAKGSMQDVAGTPVVDENLLRQIGGGAYDRAPEFSSGYFCTVSGECNGGRSCWPF